MVSVIGPRWLGIESDGTRRIDGDHDWIRREIEMALQLGIPVIPVLVEQGKMPPSQVLPEGMRDITRLNALVVEVGPDFEQQFTRLTTAIDRIGPTGSPVPKSPASKPLIELLLSIGRYKLALSIVAGCLLVFAGSSAIVVERRHALADDSYRTLFADPRQTTSTLESVQRALCVPLADLGSVGTLTLKLADIYKQTENHGRDVDLSTRLTSQDVSKLLAAGPCPTGYRNFFERRAFPKSINDPQLIAMLNKVRGWAAGVIPMDATEAEIRAGIRDARAALSVPPTSPALADQVTPDLFRKLEGGT